MLRGDGDRAVGAAYDGTIVIERIGGAKIDEKSNVPRATHEGDRGADFDAEGFVGLGIRNARRSCSIVATTAPDLYGAGRGSGATGICCGTNTRWIRSRADVAFNFLLCVLANDESRQEK